MSQVSFVLGDFHLWFFFFVSLHGICKRSAPPPAGSNGITRSAMIATALGNSHRVLFGFSLPHLPFVGFILYLDSPCRWRSIDSIPLYWLVSIVQKRHFFQLDGSARRFRSLGSSLERRKLWLSENTEASNNADPGR